MPADLLGESLRVILHELVAQHVLCRKLIQPGRIRGGPDLAFPLGLENIFHTGRNVAAFHKFRVVGDTHNPRGDHEARTLGCYPVDVGVGRGRSLQDRVPIDLPEHPLFQPT